MTTSLPVIEPSLSFKYSLDRRIKELTGDNPRLDRGSRIIPRWAAIGAGLATGLTVGLIIVLTPTNQGMENNGFAAGDLNFADNRELAASLVDSAAIDKDSIETEEQFYDIDKHSRVVSGH